MELEGNLALGINLKVFTSSLGIQADGARAMIVAVIGFDR